MPTCENRQNSRYVSDTNRVLANKALNRCRIDAADSESDAPPPSLVLPWSSRDRPDHSSTGGCRCNVDGCCDAESAGTGWGRNDEGEGEGEVEKIPLSGLDTRGSSADDGDTTGTGAVARVVVAVAVAAAGRSNCLA